MADGPDTQTSFWLTWEDLFGHTNDYIIRPIHLYFIVGQIHSCCPVTIISDLSSRSWDRHLDQSMQLKEPVIKLVAFFSHLIPPYWLSDILESHILIFRILMTFFWTTIVLINRLKSQSKIFALDHLPLLGQTLGLIGLHAGCTNHLVMVIPIGWDCWCVNLAKCSKSFTNL